MLPGWCGVEQKMQSRPRCCSRWVPSLSCRTMARWFSPDYCWMTGSTQANFCSPHHDCASHPERRCVRTPRALEGFRARGAFGGRGRRWWHRNRGWDGWHRDRTGQGLAGGARCSDPPTPENGMSAFLPRDGCPPRKPPAPANGLDSARVRATARMKDRTRRLTTGGPAAPTHGQQHEPRAVPAGTPFRGVLALTKIREYAKIRSGQFREASNWPVAGTMTSPAGVPRPRSAGKRPASWY